MGQALKSKADLDAMLRELAAENGTDSAPSQASMTSGTAAWMHRRLVAMISDFEGELTDAEELAVQIPGRPVGEIFYLETIAFWDPDMIVLLGTDASHAPLRYTHHITHLGYTLLGAPKIHEKAVRISDALKASLPKG